MWNRPESRNAWLVISVMPPRSPVISALAMAPVWPGSASTTRRPIAWRTRAIAAITCSDSGGSDRFATISRRRGRVADGAQRLEPGRAGEIVVARQRGPRRRAQRCLEAHGVAGLERLRPRSSCARARDRATHAPRASPAPPRGWSGAGPCWGAARPARRSRRRRSGPICRSSTGARMASVRSLPAANPSATASSAAVASAANPLRPSDEMHGQRRHRRQHGGDASKARTAAGNRARCRRRTSPAATETSGPARLRGCV